MAKTDLIVRLVGQTEGLRKDLAKANSSMNKFKSSVGKIGVAIAGAFAVTAIADFTKEAFKLSQEFDGISRAFSRLQNSEKLLNDITRATGGAVNQMRLMQMSVQAVNLGIDQNQLAKFFEFATIRAAETGESVDYLVNSIVTGVGRGSIMILDNLGISSQALGAGFASAADKAERVARVIDDQLGKSALTIEDAAKGTDRVSAAFTNLQVSVGNFINSEGAQGTLNFFARMIDGASKMLEAITYTTAKSEAELRKVLEQTVIAMQQVTDPEDLKVIQKTYEDVKQKLLDIARTKDVVVEKTKGYVKELQKVGPTLSGISTDGVGSLFDEKVIDAQDRMAASIRTVNVEMREQLDLTNGLMVAMTNMGDVAINLNATMTEFAATMGVSLGNALGDAFTGVGNFGATILGAVGGFMQQLGALMIKTAISVQAFKKALIASPGVALAAGIALVAIGRAFQNQASSMTSSMGSAGGGGFSSSGSSAGISNRTVGIGSRESNAVEVNVVGMIKGSDLQFVLDKNSRNRGIGG